MTNRFSVPGLTLPQGQGSTMFRMNDNALRTVEAQIREQAAAYCESNNVPGFVAGVYHAGEQIVVAHGTANLATGAPMLEDTGFLFGSVAKVLTTTLVLQQVDRGLLDLDAPVVKYLPEFALAAPGAEHLAEPAQRHGAAGPADSSPADAAGRRSRAGCRRRGTAGRPAR
ncbi:serine hydrolase domain-containing protein [Nonomuraea sp. NPDC050536]|uniref:serine hydrolase domain-containing protein n=1 Tax=Nonomuraea sp. NPDC050536 TaxID=3364366 RepID=UPI0037C529F8